MNKNNKVSFKEKNLVALVALPNYLNICSVHFKKCSMTSTML